MESNLLQCDALVAVAERATGPHWPVDQNAQ